MMHYSHINKDSSLTETTTYSCYSVRLISLKQLYLFVLDKEAVHIPIITYAAMFQRGGK